MDNTLGSVEHMSGNPEGSAPGRKDGNSPSRWPIHRSKTNRAPESVDRHLFLMRCIHRINPATALITQIMSDGNSSDSRSGSVRAH